MKKFHGLGLVFIMMLLLAREMKAAEHEEKGRRKWGGGEGGEEEEGGIFVMKNSKQVVKTDAGEMRIMRGYRSRSTPNPMHIGFIQMEPDTLFVPQYLDANLILFVRRGDVKIGWIHKDKMVEKNFTIGDVYRIPAGSAFFMENIGKGQQLQMICSIDTSEGLGFVPFQSFYIGGGTFPKSVLAGFGMRTLATAFNVTEEVLQPVMRRQAEGPFVYMTGSHQPSKWASFMKSEHRKIQEQVAFEVDDEDDGEDIKQVKPTKWSWKKLLNSLLGMEEEEEEEENKSRAVHYPDSYNLYSRTPGFKNNYGWSIAVDGHAYTPLKRCDIGVYLVNLTAGSMMAPHVNPIATEYGIVLKGTGRIQIVFPNGSLAMDAEVKEGDVFWIPRYFPFCQIASMSGPLEFFGFTTTARRNRPLFLAGTNSVMNSMMGPELAAAFDIPEEELRKIVTQQKHAIILPSWSLPPHRGKKEPPAIERHGLLSFN